MQNFKMIEIYPLAKYKNISTIIVHFQFSG